MRWTLLYFAAVLVVAVSVPIQTAAGSPLEVADFGEGLSADEPALTFENPADGIRQLLSVLEESPDMAEHLRSIRAYRYYLNGSGQVVPCLRELVVRLRESQREQAKVETAFIVGLLIQEDTKEARPQYIKDLAGLIATIRESMPLDPWARLVVAMLYGSIPELQGNWFDEALHAQCYGYDDAQLLLAAGSFLLAMDLAYGGNQRLQWFAYLALARARELSPGQTALHERITALVRTNLQVPGYRPSKWLNALMPG